MKRLAAILFLVLFLIQIAGFYTYFFVRLSEIHDQVRKQMAHWPEEKLSVLTFEPSQVKGDWLEEMEFEWEGKMFDIARVEYASGIVKIYCVHDTAEDNLLAFLDNVTRSASQDERSVPPQVLQFITLLFTKPETILNFAIPRPVEAQTTYINLYSSPVTALASPPPRV